MSCSLYTKPSSFLYSNFPEVFFEQFVRTNSLLCNQGFVSRFVTIYESAVVKEDYYNV